MLDITLYLIFHCWKFLYDHKRRNFSPDLIFGLKKELCKILCRLSMVNVRNYFHTSLNGSSINIQLRVYVLRLYVNIVVLMISLKKVYGWNFFFFTTDHYLLFEWSVLKKVLWVSYDWTFVINKKQNNKTIFFIFQKTRKTVK